MEKPLSKSIIVHYSPTFHMKHINPSIMWISATDAIKSKTKNIFSWNKLTTTKKKWIKHSGGWCCDIACQLETVLLIFSPWFLEFFEFLFYYKFSFNEAFANIETNWRGKLRWKFILNKLCTPNIELTFCVLRKHIKDQDLKRLLCIQIIPEIYFSCAFT